MYGEVQCTTEQTMVMVMERNAVRHLLAVPRHYGPATRMSTDHERVVQTAARLLHTAVQSTGFVQRDRKLRASTGSCANETLTSHVMCSIRDAETHPRQIFVNRQIYRPIL